MFVGENFNIDNQSDAVANRKLCELRGSCDDRIFDRAELNIMFIDMLCIRSTWICMYIEIIFVFDYMGG